MTITAGFQLYQAISPNCYGKSYVCAPVVCLSATLCIVAKRYVLKEKLLLIAKLITRI